MLKAESAGVLGGGYARLRKGLVVTQVALSLLLLVGSGVFLRSLQNLLAVDAGFDTARLLSFSVDAGRRTATRRPRPRCLPRRCSSACARRPA